MHRVAVNAWLRPDEPMKLALQASLEDDRLLAGAVPQPADWLRAWSAARIPQSWESAAKTAHTEHFIRHSRDKSVATRPIMQMVAVMREELRRANKRNDPQL